MPMNNNDKDNNKKNNNKNNATATGVNIDEYLAFILIVRYKLNMQYFTIRIIIYTLEYTNYFNVLCFYSFVKKEICFIVRF